MKSTLSYTILLVSLFFVSQTHLFSQKNNKPVKIGEQTWMSVNLNVSVFRNGDVIPEIQSDDDWKKAGEEGKPAWCYYKNDEKNGKKYGKLYNWYAVNDPRGLAPEGWHIPTNDEWMVLVNLFHGPTAAAYYLKSKKGWGKEAKADNSSKFSALPGGMRDDGKAEFLYIGSLGAFWTSTLDEDGMARFQSILDRLSYITSFSDPKDKGLSVRCIKD